MPRYVYILPVRLVILAGFLLTTYHSPSEAQEPRLNAGEFEQKVTPALPAQEFRYEAVVTEWFVAETSASLPDMGLGLSAGEIDGIVTGLEAVRDGLGHGLASDGSQYTGNVSRERLRDETAAGLRDMGLGLSTEEIDQIVTGLEALSFSSAKAAGGEADALLTDLLAGKPPNGGWSAQ